MARDAARAAEKHAVRDVLKRVHWNRPEAARVFRVSYKTLLTKIVEIGIGPPSMRRTRPPAGDSMDRGPVLPLH